MQERVGHEPQTPMVFEGFGVAPAILVQAQRLFPSLIKGLTRPAVQIWGDNPLGPPVGAVRDQPGRSAGQVGSLDTEDQPDLAQAWAAHGQGKRPVGLVADRDRPLSGGGDEWHQIFDTAVRPGQCNTVSGRVLEHKAVGFQGPVLFHEAEPIRRAAVENGHHIFSQLPPSAQDHPEGHLMPQGGCPQCTRQWAFGLHLLGQSRKLWLRHQNRVNFLV